MNENEKSGGYPIDDEELNQVSGGMRVQSTGMSVTKKCPVCGSYNTVVRDSDNGYRMCNMPGCGTIFHANSGVVVGVDSTVANKK